MNVVFGNRHGSVRGSRIRAIRGAGDGRLGRWAQKTGRWSSSRTIRTLPIWWISTCVERASVCCWRATAKRGWRSSGRRTPASSSSMSASRAPATGSTCAVPSVPGARCPSSSSRRVTTRWTASSDWRWGPTITWSSRSRRGSWWRGCAPFCGGRGKARHPRTCSFWAISRSTSAAARRAGPVRSWRSTTREFDLLAFLAEQRRPCALAPATPRRCLGLRLVRRRADGRCPRGPAPQEARIRSPPGHRLGRRLPVRLTDATPPHAGHGRPCRGGAGHRRSGQPHPHPQRGAQPGATTAGFRGRITDVARSPAASRRPGGHQEDAQTRGRRPHHDHRPRQRRHGPPCGSHRRRTSTWRVSNRGRAARVAGATSSTPRRRSRSRRRSGRRSPRPRITPA